MGRAVQRAGTFAELPALLTEFDVEPVDVFAGTGIDPNGLKPGSVLPIDGILLTLDRAAKVLSCPHIGLLLGSRFTTQIHGPIGRLMESAPTLRVALTDFITWQQGYSTAAVVYLSRMGDDYALGYGMYDRKSPGVRHLHDGIVAIGCRLVAELTGGRVKPSGVLLSVRRPEDARAYRRILGVPAEFDHEQTCVIIGARTMDAPLAKADPARRAAALADIAAMTAASFIHTATRTRHVIRPLLHEGRPSMRDAAEVLGLHPRSLRRKLASENATFEKLRDEVRFTVAQELLDMTDMPISAISLALAYASPSAFVEAFRRWADVTPSHWRKHRSLRASE